MQYNELLAKYPQLKTYECRGMQRVCEPGYRERLNRCQAWYGLQGGDSSDFALVVLVSYKTVVAIYDKRENTVYDFLRAVYGYTSTSCQHIRKFTDKMRYSFNRPGTVKDYPRVIRIDD